MKYIKLFCLAIMVGMLLLIPETSAYAQEHEAFLGIDPGSTYPYSFKLLTSSDVKFKIIDTEGDSIPIAYIIDNSDLSKENLDYSKSGSVSVYLKAGTYTLCITNLNELIMNTTVIITTRDTEIGEDITGEDVNEDSEDYEEDYEEDEDKGEITSDLIEIPILLPEPINDSSGYSFELVNGIGVYSIDIPFSTYFGLYIKYVKTALVTEDDDVGASVSREFADTDFKFSKAIITPDEYGDYYCNKSGDTVLTVNYKGITIKIKIHVYDINYLLEKNKYTVKYGKTVNLDFSKDNKAYASYSNVRKAESSNRKVANYDVTTGEITAVGAGTCTFTFTMDNSQKLTCKVTVPKLTLLENIDAQVAYSSDLSLIKYETIKKIKYPYADVFIGNRLKETKTITYVEYAMYQYDNKGKRVNVSDSDFIWNDNIYGGSFIHVYTSANVKKYHSCVKKVYYDDDSTWTNPYYKAWEKKYKTKY